MFHEMSVNVFNSSKAKYKRNSIYFPKCSAQECYKMLRIF